MRESRVRNAMRREYFIIKSSVSLTLLCDSFFTQAQIFKCIITNICYTINNVLSEGYSCFIQHYFKRFAES